MNVSMLLLEYLHVNRYFSFWTCLTPTLKQFLKNSLLNRSFQTKFNRDFLFICY